MKPEQRDHLLDHPKVNPRARALFKTLLQQVRAQGLPLIVVEVYRSPERQRLLYAQGRTDAALKAKGYTDQQIQQARARGYTQNKPIVTKILNGAHTQGRAMDCAFVVMGQLTYTVNQHWWNVYGNVAKTLGLTWGGDWTMKDYPHVELKEGDN